MKYFFRRHGFSKQDTRHQSDRNIINLFWFKG